MRSTKKARARTVLAWTATALLACVSTLTAQAAASGTTTVVNYNADSLTQYNQMWSNIYGPLDNAAESVTKGAFTVSDVPFKPGTDYSVFDHLKYLAVSNKTFPAPANGTVTFSVSIAASTPGAQAGHVVHGKYGPPGSYANPSAPDYSAPVLEGQQAGVVLNMIDFCSGQLFDWFVSSHSAFPLIERLPSTITNNTTNPACTDAPTVDLSTAYTQIIKQVPVTAGAAHRVAISFSQGTGGATVSYSLDDTVVATVSNVGIPLDKQGIPFSGTYPSLGDGELLAGKIKSFSIGHGLFSLLDAFPFQYGCAPGPCTAADAARSVSISPAERSFGQGAVGTFNGFQVKTQTK